MIPPIKTWLLASPQIVAIVADRVYGSGYADEQADPPGPTYIAFQLVAKDSPIYLGQNQDCDYDRVQIHCWSGSEAEAEDLCDLCRSAINPYGNVVGGVIADYDPDSKLYRCGFDFGGWRDI
jgi:hypothetical protein